MLSFFQRQNADSVIIKFLRYSGLSISPQTVVEELDKHPDYPSLLAISDVLTNFNIDNDAFRLTGDELQSLPGPFIVHGRTKGGEFMMLHLIDADQAIVSTEKLNKHKLTRENFDKLYGGVALIADAPESVTNKPKVGSFFSAIRIPAIAVSCLVILSLLIGFNADFGAGVTWPWMILSLAKSIGLIVSVLLLVQALDKNNPLIQVLCTAGGKKADCSAILSSKAANAFWGYSWSEIGFFYFAGTWLLVLFGGSAVVWKALLLLNIISLPYTFYSIYYQARVAQQWCTLCCTIQALLWVEFIPLLNANLPLNFGFPVQLKDISILIVCLLSPVVLWAMLKPLFLKAQQLQPTKDQLRRFKYNTELFNLMLNDQPKYAMPDERWSIVLGNVEANTIITMVTNPYCPPCAKAHRLLDELLEQKGNVQARIVFSTLNRDDDERTPVARHMMALYKKGNENFIRQAMHDWYNEKQKNFEAWAKKYPVDIDETQFYKLDNQRDWCNLAEVKATPTLLLNGRVLPSVYQLSDLKYMLE
jgi:uncharacterized membrane protein/thiol-disulfide isomerase/thioredoxin